MFDLPLSYMGENVCVEYFFGQYARCCKEGREGQVDDEDEERERERE
jgi:hypothetical protein